DVVLRRDRGLAAGGGARAPAADPNVDGTRSGATRGSEAGVNRPAVAEDVRGLRHPSQRAAGKSGKFHARCAENRVKGFRMRRSFLLARGSWRQVRSRVFREVDARVRHGPVRDKQHIRYIFTTLTLGSSENLPRGCGELLETRLPGSGGRGAQ